MLIILFNKSEIYLKSNCSTNLELIIDQALGLLYDNGLFILESAPQEFSNAPFRIREFGDTQLNFWKNES